MIRDAASEVIVPIITQGQGKNNRHSGTAADTQAGGIPILSRGFRSGA